jgi:hypothetical protein
MYVDVMKTHDHSHLPILLLVGGLLIVMLMTARPAGTPEGGWIDQLRGLVLLQRSIAPPDIPGAFEQTASFDPYLGQLELVRNLFRVGNHHGTYVAMNRLMDMLEAREAGISGDAVDAIWDYCYRVTPAAYHDVSRHLKVRSRTNIDGFNSTEELNAPPLW